MMHKTIEDSQDVRDETFLLQHSARPSRIVSLDQARDEIVASLEMSRVGSKAVDPVARSFSMGRISGLEEALRILNKALQAEHAARIRAAAQDRPRS
jgi:hypothetical protein